MSLFPDAWKSKGEIFIFFLIFFNLLENSVEVEVWEVWVECVSS